MIIICDCCGQYVCPSSCPNYICELVFVGSAKGRCFGCEGYVRDDDGHQSYNGKLLCEDCARELISAELLEFLQCDNIKDFFDLLW